MELIKFLNRFLLCMLLQGMFFLSKTVVADFDVDTNSEIVDQETQGDSCSPEVPSLVDETAFEVDQEKKESSFSDKLYEDPDIEENTATTDENVFEEENDSNKEDQDECEDLEEGIDEDSYVDEELPTLSKELSNDVQNLHDLYRQELEDFSLNNVAKKPSRQSWYDWFVGWFYNK